MQILRRKGGYSGKSGGNQGALPVISRFQSQPQQADGPVGNAGADIRQMGNMPEVSAEAKARLGDAIARIIAARFLREAGRYQEAEKVLE